MNVNIGVALKGELVNRVVASPLLLKIEEEAEVKAGVASMSVKSLEAGTSLERGCQIHIFPPSEVKRFIKEADLKLVKMVYFTYKEGKEVKFLKEVRGNGILTVAEKYYNKIP